MEQAPAKKKAAPKKAAGKVPAKEKDVKAGSGPAAVSAPSGEAAPAEEKPRIGVFVCHCGVNIAGFFGVEDVTEYAKTLPGMVFATRNLYTCAEDGLQDIKEAIREHDLNRVVVASCTPRTH